MISPGEARRGIPPARSSRARARSRRSGKVSAERLGSAAGPPARSFASHVAAATPPPEWPAEQWVPDLPAVTGDRPPHDALDLPVTAVAFPVGGPATATATATMERPEADETPPGSKKRSGLRNTVEWVLIIGAALTAAVIIKTYLIQAFYIPSASMEHTLNIQDRVLVNKLSYRLHDIHRGDIVVFERPPNDVGQIRDLIKRVVALPGETVEGREGIVYVDGRALEEPYLERGVVTGDFPLKRIPDGYIWVMGDNRGNSSDSRVFGAVAESRIIGRAFIRVWPITALGLL